MHRSVALLALVSCCLAGCASSGSTATVHDADEPMVEGCEFLGNVSGRAFLAPPGSGDRVDRNAKNKARKSAAGLGATHVVWLGGGSGFGPALAEGRAYRCGG